MKEVESREAANEILWVAGVDGCRAGWVTVLLPVREPVSARVVVSASFDEVLALPENPARIAVDMPIGLADRVGLGGRACDIEARRRLGQRQSAVFTVPARAAVMETDYRRACEVSVAHSDPPRMVSKQCYFLFPKIREIDARMDAQLQNHVFECHPELAFWAMNGRQPLDLPKKVKSRPYQPGLELRRRLLMGAGLAPASLEPLDKLPTTVGPDDLLDAMACAWTAKRVYEGVAVRFPEEPPTDGRGLRMEIWT